MYLQEMKNTLLLQNIIEYYIDRYMRYSKKNHQVRNSNLVCSSTKKI